MLCECVLPVSEDPIRKVVHWQYQGTGRDAKRFFTAGGEVAGSESRAFRLVCGSGQCAGVEDLLRAEGFTFRELPFSPLARELLSGPRPLGSSVAASFGWIYIQDRSSMLPPLCLDPGPGAGVLDLCASPGGKTGFLSQLVGPEGLVLANEPNPRRLWTLRQNLRGMNRCNAASCSYRGEAIPLRAASWANILVDAPCSGWGTVERHPRVASLWKGDKVEPLIRLQRRLLSTAAGLLTPGGRLVYSTCTTNVRENEEQVLWAEEELGLERVLLEPRPGFAYDSPMQGAAGCLRVVGGGETRAQGFFVAGLVTAGTEHGSGNGTGEGSPGWEGLPGQELDSRILTAVPGLDPGNLPPGRVQAFGDRVFFLPRMTRSLLPHDFSWQGYPLGRLQAGTFRPDPLARRLLPHGHTTPGLHLDSIEQVRALLSGQSLTLDAPPESAGLYWKDLPLGWLTVKGRRVLWGK